MNEPPQLLRPTRQSSGQSPTRQKHQRISDDILAHLAPATAVEALASATGPLRACLLGASAAERDFAVRAAAASRMVWEWVDELEDWSWPADGGAAGFEMPGGKRKKLSIQVTAPEGEQEEYIGSLSAADVARYQNRTEDIQREVDKLNVEEIKSHVLTNHIIPLSRPSTPILEPIRATRTVSTYNKMDDLTAVVTAIVVQMLPNLAKLSRLLHTWAMRLSLLQTTPALLRAIADAEIALRSGWTAITTPPRKGGEDEGAPQVPTLTRDGFNVMNPILQQKVSKPARTLDYMLDCLEGMPDTLPDRWLDRMDAVEQDYGEWVAACDRTIRETGWASAIHSRQAPRSPSPEKDHKGQNGSATRSDGRFIPGAADSAVAFPVPLATRHVEEPSKERRDAEVVGPTTKLQDRFPRQDEGDGDETPEPDVQPALGLDGARDITPTAQLQRHSPTIGSQKALRRLEKPKWISADDICSPVDATGPAEEEEEEDLELPPLRDGSRRNSDASQTSTVMHGASSHFGGLSSDLPEVSVSPGVPRSRVREAEYLTASPPSSPPTAPTEPLEESSVMVPDSPLLTPLALAIPEEDDNSLFGQANAESSFMDDFDDSFSVSEVPSPMDRRESIGDQQLRQQITEIIESIPAKIKLSAEPPVINLNPPDLQLPRLRKRPSKEPVRRSASAMSTISSRATSRAGTPSFTLSPAKNARARNQRGQQEIKVYHLSRSTGEAPIKLFIRCVGERGERVMVRVGGGWADLSEYLKEYASHHGRRSGGSEKPKVEIRDLPRVASGVRGANHASSPPSRPASALDMPPATPLNVRKTRRSLGAASSEAPRLQHPRTPVAVSRGTEDTPPSDAGSTRSRSSSRLSWVEDDSSFLGLAGPSGKKVDMSEENKAWVESVKEKVRLASGEMRVPPPEERNRFGEIGKVGGTKRLFRKGEEKREAKK